MCAGALCPLDLRKHGLWRPVTTPLSRLRGCRSRSCGVRNEGMSKPANRRLVLRGSQSSTHRSFPGVTAHATRHPRCREHCSRCLPMLPSSREGPPVLPTSNRYCASSVREFRAAIRSLGCARAPAQTTLRHGARGDAYPRVKPGERKCAPGSQDLRLRGPETHTRLRLPGIERTRVESIELTCIERLHASASAEGVKNPPVKN